MLIQITTYYTGTQMMAGGGPGNDGASRALCVADLALFQQLSSQLFGGLFGIAALAGSLGMAMGDAKSVAEILATNPASMLAAGGRTLGSGCKGDLELKGVTFAYPAGPTAAGGEGGEPAGGEPAAAVLQNLSLHFKPGSVTALVGRSGSGKSTVLAVIQRFYDVEGGQVLLDGVPLQEMDVRWLRRQMGNVEQEPGDSMLSHS